ncbi:MAG: ferritin family protein [bacterium]|nr:ferritin family protein [bacterium]
MNSFTPAEALEFAVQIEENGEKFYRHMAEKIEDAGAKKVFTYLADEEIKHRGLYAKMLSKIESYKPAENYPEEYFAYLRAYVKKVIFSPQRLEEEMERIATKEEAVEFAIRTELENILYFEELKKLVNEDDTQIIEEVINEERKHFLELSSLKKVL